MPPGTLQTALRASRSKPTTESGVCAGKPWLERAPRSYL